MRPPMMSLLTKRERHPWWRSGFSMHCPSERRSCFADETRSSHHHVQPGDLTDVKRCTREGAALAACLLVYGVDTLFALCSPPLVLKAVLDESAHISTALLLLLALREIPSEQLALAVAVGSVLLDIDHIPMTIQHTGNLVGLARPDSHSAPTLLAAFGFAKYLPLKARPYAAGIAFGFCAHLARDLATGGVPLFWPVTYNFIKVPYAAYSLALLLSAGAFVWRGKRHD